MSDKAERARVRRLKRAEYNRIYYQKRKKEIAERKRLRYEHDDEYRAGVALRRTLQYEKEKIDRTTVAKLPFVERPGKIMRVALGDGNMVPATMFTIGQLAFQIGITQYTLRKWIREGVMPEALFWSDAGRRLFTSDQGDVIKDTARRHGFWLKGHHWKIRGDFTEELQANLSALHNGVKIDPEED